MDTACTQNAVLHTAPPHPPVHDISPCVPRLFSFSPTDVLQLYHHFHSPSKAVRSSGNCDRGDRSTVAVQCETIAIERPSVNRGARRGRGILYIYSILIKTLLGARSESPVSPLFIGSFPNLATSKTEAIAEVQCLATPPPPPDSMVMRYRCSIHEWGIYCASAEA